MGKVPRFTTAHGTAYGQHMEIYEGSARGERAAYGPHMGRVRKSSGLLPPPRVAGLNAVRGFRGRAPRPLPPIWGSLPGSVGSGRSGPGRSGPGRVAPGRPLGSGRSGGSWPLGPSGPGRVAPGRPLWVGSLKVMTPLRALRENSSQSVETWIALGENLFQSDQTEKYFS